MKCDLRLPGCRQLFLQLLLLAFPAISFATEFAGSSVCQSCHPVQYQLWQKSHHFRAMQVPTLESVEGDFADVTRTFHGVTSRFFKKGEDFLVETTGADGSTSTFRVKYTFGFMPLQQYLVELDDGHVQALNVSWDNRPGAEGGQRWFHLRPDEAMTPEHPFYWTRHFQNWNSRCAACHSTGVDKGYDSKTHHFDTTFSEPNVACEACHGSGTRHLDLANSKKLTPADNGFLQQPPVPLTWSFGVEDKIAQPGGARNDHLIDMCGECHSLRTKLLSSNGAISYHDRYRLELLNEQSYFPDGQIKEEVFVLGSFLQSRMYNKGVTCANCHNPHSGELLVEGNGTCTQCHSPTTYDSVTHHQHPVDGEAAQCITCHMPERTYMGVDQRRDHSFTIPRPHLALETDIPNACYSCHRDSFKDAASAREWLAKKNRQWYGNPAPHWSEQKQNLVRSGMASPDELDKILTELAPSDFVRASILAQLASVPSAATLDVLAEQLTNKSPLIRRGAIRGLTNFPGTLQWRLLEPLLTDPNRPVRYEIAETLLGSYNQLTTIEQRELKPLIDEYKVNLKANEDSPAAQLKLAHLAMSMGDFITAEKSLREALFIEPNYIPALINLADTLRASNQSSKVSNILEKALEIEPANGAANHSYGLHLIRQKQYSRALGYLENAVKAADADSRYFYVYAVALENQGQLGEAIRILETAEQRWPNQYSTLMTLVQYLDKAERPLQVIQYLGRLRKLAPDSPQVQSMIYKYSQPSRN